MNSISSICSLLESGPSFPSKASTEGALLVLDLNGVNSVGLGIGWSNDKLDTTALDTHGMWESLDKVAKY